MLTSAATRRLLAVALIATTSLLGLVGLATNPAPAQAATDDPSGVSITVDVLGTVSPGAGSTSGVLPLMTSPAGRLTEVPGVSQTTLRNPAAADAALGANPANIHDVFHVSGLTGRADPNFGPSGADLALEFTMKNVSTASTTSSLRFWLDNAINLPVKTLDKIEVTNLAPGETRTITATFTDVSQWTFFRGHVTMTPAVDVAGTALQSVTRDSFTLILPRFLLAVLVLVGALYLAAQQLVRLRRLHGPVPARARAFEDGQVAS